MFIRPARTSRRAAMIWNELYHTPGSKGGGACVAISSFSSSGVVYLVSYHCGLPRGPCGLPLAIFSLEPLWNRTSIAPTSPQHLQLRRIIIDDDFYHWCLSSIWLMGERKLFIVTMTADTELISSRLVGMPGAGISFIHVHRDLWYVHEILILMICASKFSTLKLKENPLPRAA